MAICRHCDRSIVKVDGAWIDPEATGDDSVWRETCDAHDDFLADHEPVPSFRITATVHHGGYFETFEVEASKASDLLPLFEKSTYMPRAETAEFRAASIWRDLVTLGRSEFGWVRYALTVIE